MRVYLYPHAPIRLQYMELDTILSKSFPHTLVREVPEDVLDRHDKALAEYQAVQRILELYKNEG